MKDKTPTLCDTCRWYLSAIIAEHKKSLGLVFGKKTFYIMPIIMKVDFVLETHCF